MVTVAVPATRLKSASVTKGSENPKEHHILANVKPSPDEAIYNRFLSSLSPDGSALASKSLVIT